jgi:hypothetical protein
MVAVCDAGSPSPFPFAGKGERQGTFLGAGKQ